MLKCPFCEKHLVISMYASECKDCNTNYISHQIDYKIKDSWETYYFNFHFDDPVYYGLTINYQDHETTIWLHNPGAAWEHRMKPMKLPHSFPNVNPQNALDLARKLHRLIIFS